MYCSRSNSFLRRWKCFQFVKCIQERLSEICHPYQQLPPNFLCNGQTLCNKWQWTATEHPKKSFPSCFFVLPHFVVSLPSSSICTLEIDAWVHTTSYKFLKLKTEMIRKWPKAYILLLATWLHQSLKKKSYHLAKQCFIHCPWNQSRITSQKPVWQSSS
jgi:hypothetical protein